MKVDLTYMAKSSGSFVPWFGYAHIPQVSVPPYHTLWAP